MIEHTLNLQQADDFFDREAILFGKSNGIPEYRIVELFGEWAGAFFVKHAHCNGYMIAGEDFNSLGGGSSDIPLIHFLYRAGFRKVVTEHNFRCAVAHHRSNEAGRVVDVLWQARHERLEAAEAEEERKRQARRKKRAAR